MGERGRGLSLIVMPVVPWARTGHYLRVVMYTYIVTAEEHQIEFTTFRKADLYSIGIVGVVMLIEKYIEEDEDPLTGKGDIRIEEFNKGEETGLLEVPADTMFTNMGLITVTKLKGKMH